ncbi:restriction endonuclease subunit S [Haloferula sargassicola]|uniref:restriction endonuclease subunit S n=1 Tax=Haloferula sargassicola TaxID=490096 RepID=UPI0033658253
MKALHVPATYGEPPDGWTWSRLDDVSEGVFDCPHSTPKLTDAGLYVVRTQDIITGVFRADQAAHVSDETYAERIARVTPSRGDLLYSREGTYFGIAAEVPENTRVCLGQRMVLIRPKPEILDFSFLRYWLNSPIMAGHIHGYRDGSVAERLNLPTIRALPVLLPPLATQKSIAAVLGALDDKIELNRRMNVTLEAMARALFQSWFVDFDPVRAKLDGRQSPNLDPATAALFPDSFQDSELGHIPKGWEVGSILQQARLLSGGTPKTDVADYWNGDIPWASAKDVSQCGEAFLIATERCITQRGLDKSATKMIPEFATVIVARGATTGRLTMFGKTIAMNQTCYALDTKVEAPFALYCQARHFIERMVLSAHGSVFDTITTRTFETTSVLLPPPEVLRAFDRQAAPIFQQIRASLRQSHTLATLRDTLLPKLLSGEIAVRPVGP